MAVLAGREVLPPRIGLVVLDADYTCTKPIAGGEEAYEQAFIDSLRVSLGEGDAALFAERWKAAKAQVVSERGVHGFIFKEDVGIVAAAESDVMMAMHAVGWLLTRTYYDQVPHSAYANMAYAAYKAGYPKLGMTIVPELPLLLRGLRDRKIPAVVVTNSAADAVRANLARGLGDEFPAFLDGVQGHAAKFEIDPDWEVPHMIVRAYTNLDGLQYPVLLRRRAYYEAITRAREAVGGLKCDQVLVIGDNTQLDLMMPDALGMQTALVESATTAPWDRAWIRDTGHLAWRSPITTLDRVLSFFQLGE